MRLQDKRQQWNELIYCKINQSTSWKEEDSNLTIPRQVTSSPTSIVTLGPPPPKGTLRDKKLGLAEQQ
jgi:hypothetical protein